jgi:hypothetical protein
MSYVALIFIGLCVAPVMAHVAIDYPAGGENYAPGEIVKIQWHIEIPHEQDNWDLFYSVDNGLSWDTIIIDLAETDMEYDWVLPAVSTNKARVKIIQDNVASNYEAVSTQFTIQDPAAGDILNGSPESTIGFCNCITGYTYGLAVFSFSLNRPEHVTLEIFDITGRLQESLMNETLTPGFYTLEFNSPGRRAIKQYVYTIRAGEFVQSGMFIKR